MDEIFQVKSYIEVWESDLSRFVSEFYGRPWRLQQQDGGLSQNTYLKEWVFSSGADGWCGIEEETLAAWLALPVPASGDWSGVMEFERRHYLNVRLVLWDLCRKDVIPSGEYLITVWW